jgi:ribosomal protein L37AE/L43A
VHAHVSRQPGSWLTWDVRQNKMNLLARYRRLRSCLNWFYGIAVALTLALLLFDPKFGRLPGILLVGGILIVITLNAIFGRVRCPSCQKNVIVSIDKFCPSCGVDLAKSPVEGHICSVCGSNLSHTRFGRAFAIRYCTHCGTHIDDKGA